MSRVNPSTVVLTLPWTSVGKLAHRLKNEGVKVRPFLYQSLHE
jgi:hypothetical protein